MDKAIVKRTVGNDKPTHVVFMLLMVYGMNYGLQFMKAPLIKKAQGILGSRNKVTRSSCRRGCKSCDIKMDYLAVHV